MDFIRRVEDLKRVKESIIKYSSKNILFNTEKKIRDIDQLIEINTELSRHNIVVIPGDQNIWLKVKRGKNGNSNRIIR